MERVKQTLRDLDYRHKLMLTFFIVSIIPLLICGIFCYFQTVHLLLRQENASLNTAAETAAKSMDAQYTLYSDLLTYLSTAGTIVEAPGIPSLGKVDQHDRFTYDLDVFLSATMAQHPAIRQITVYTAQESVTHGRQYRPLSDLYAESWFSPSAITAQPRWYRKDDGSLILIQHIADPYVRYVQSYSQNCICIELDSRLFFGPLDDTAADCHLRIASAEQTLFDYRAPSVADYDASGAEWTSLNKTVDSAGWAILLEKPTALVAAPAKEMALVVIAVMLLSLALATLASNLLSRLFVRRIDLLAGSMEKVAAGDFSVQIHDAAKDEIGVLTNTFQSMTGQIDQLIRENYQKELDVRASQLKALQAQINPHFLYNCLSLINSKALMNHQPEISKMALQLSTFYRTTLNKGKSTTLLQNEVKNVTSYVEIQQLLHDGCFDFTAQIDQPLPDVTVPNLLLQPLVENAIIHGILPEKERRGSLFLAIHTLGDRVQCTIMDNGVGIPPEKLSTLLTTDTGGYGLKNVHDRLVLTYGPEFGLTIRSIPGQSTIITFRLPGPTAAEQAASAAGKEST